MQQLHCADPEKSELPGDWTVRWGRRRLVWAQNKDCHFQSRLRFARSTKQAPTQITRVAKSTSSQRAPVRDTPGVTAGFGPSSPRGWKGPVLTADRVRNGKFCVCVNPGPGPAFSTGLNRETADLQRPGVAPHTGQGSQNGPRDSRRPPATSPGATGGSLRELSPTLPAPLSPG